MLLPLTLLHRLTQQRDAAHWKVFASFHKFSETVFRFFFFPCPLLFNKLSKLKGSLLYQPIRGGVTTTTSAGGTAQHVSPSSPLDLLWCSQVSLVVSLHVYSGSSNTNHLSLRLLKTSRLLAALLRLALQKLHKPPINAFRSGRCGMGLGGGGGGASMQCRSDAGGQNALCPDPVGRAECWVLLWNITCEIMGL